MEFDKCKFIGFYFIGYFFEKCSKFRRVERVEMGDFPEEEGKRKKVETEQGST